MRVNEIFRSIQGETSFQGLPACFLRLSGCNLDCVYCDTAYARDPSSGAERDWPEVVHDVLALGPGIVCVTGGEPLLQPDTVEAARALVDAGRPVLVETNGSRDIGVLPEAVVRILDIKCPGSLMSHTFFESNFERLRLHDEVKFVLKGREDYVWARDVLARRRLSERCRVLMNPAFGLLAPADLAEWVLKDGLDVRLNVQLHKYIWGPDRRGV